MHTKSQRRASSFNVSRNSMKFCIESVVLFTLLTLDNGVLLLFGCLLFHHVKNPFSESNGKAKTEPNISSQQWGQLGFGGLKKVWKGLFNIQFACCDNRLRPFNIFVCQDGLQFEIILNAAGCIRYSVQLHTVALVDHKRHPKSCSRKMQMQLIDKQKLSWHEMRSVLVHSVHCPPTDTGLLQI